MSTMDQIRGGLERAWEGMAEGWRELRERAGHALTRFQPGRGGGDVETWEQQQALGASRWGLLAAEVREDDDEVIVKLEVPGMDPDGFELHVADNVLVVQGEKRVEREQRSGRYYLMERAYGHFERAIPLPSLVQEEQASAQYRRGILQVHLPKSARAKVRRIEVKAD